MKKLLLFLSISIYSFQCFAQDPTIEWQNTIGGDSDDYLVSASPTNDGGFILGGQSDSNISGDKTEDSNGYTDYWVVKLNNIGEIEWQNTIGGNGDEWLQSISQTNDGGYILGGYSSSNISGDKTEDAIGFLDYWIVKLDNTGTVDWDNTIGGTSSDLLQMIIQTEDGGYFLGGRSNSNISGDKTEDSNGDFDYWVLKLDNSGSIEWQNTIGGSDEDWLFALDQAENGSYIIGGWSKSNISGDKTENSYNSTDFWVVKLDDSGIVEWDNTIGGNITDIVYSISQTFDGGFILGGISSSDISGDKTENSNGGLDYWVVKLDSFGDIEWQNTIGGNGWEILRSVWQTIDGGYVIGGSSNSTISGDKLEISSSYDYWPIKLDSSGNIVDQNTILADLGDRLYSISQTSDGGYFLAGSSDSNILFDKSENTNGLSDFWVLKLDDILLDTDEIEIKYSINLYPNPVNDILTIDNNSTVEITQIRLYDLLGRHVIVENRNVEQIDVTSLNSGLLFVKIETDEDVVTKKIIKQ